MDGGTFAFTILQSKFQPHKSPHRCFISRQQKKCYDEMQSFKFTIVFEPLVYHAG